MLSTAWNTQRGSQSYKEKRRGRKEIEVSRRRKGGIKRRERDILAVLCSLSVLHSLEHRDSQSFVEKRRGREEIEVSWGRKRKVKRGRE